MKKIVFNFLLVFLMFSIAIILIGVFETVRFEFMFGITEEYLMNPTELPEPIYNEYLDFRNSYLFTNSIFVTVMNFIGLVVIFYLMVSAWKTGRDSKPYTLADVFNKYGMLMILLFYFAGVLFDYFKDIFLNQIILLLWQDIYLSIYMFALFSEYFFGFLLLAYLLSFISNQLRYFDII